MELLYPTEHFTCPRFDKREKPQIEKVKIAKGVERRADIRQNEVLFMMEGKLRLNYRGFPRLDITKGQIMFLPAPDTYSYKALANTVAVVFRLSGPVGLCDCCTVDQLYGQTDAGSGEDNYLPHTKNYSLLEITPRIWHFLDGLVEDLESGVRCRSYFQLQIKKFFMMVRFYSSKEDIHDFFYYILSGDTVFSESVRLRWRDYRNVIELAASMNMSPKQFSKKFVSVFGTTPYKWMQEGKARLIYDELASGKPFKYIADEYDFHSVQEFNRFVKHKFGKTPGEIRAEKRPKGKNC